MKDLKDIVTRFYYQLWNQQDKSLIPALISEDITFRGSTGLSKNGHAGFTEYLDMIHAALNNYQCTIEDMVIENNKVFARMMFCGIHQGEFMGYSASGKQVSWAGAALFTFRDDKITDLWVLGDLTGLQQQLSGVDQIPPRC